MVGERDWCMKWGRHHASSRSVSSQRPERKGSVRRTHEKSRSSGGSPSDRKKSTTADEDLEVMILEMQNQGEQNESTDPQIRRRKEC